MLRYRKLEQERLSIDSLTFDKSHEHRFKQLRFKVVRFAMDKIRQNTIKSMEDKFVPYGADCNCMDRVIYKLPCPCIIFRHPVELPLDIVHRRRRFEHDENYEDVEEKEYDKTIEDLEEEEGK
ncbi:unnamed protein product [Rhizopus stolonifer]